MTECKKDSDENRLIREGTTQEERFPAALDPAYAPVDDWKIEHGILFAKAYAKFLKYYDAGNREAGDWQPFFSKDVSALLAVMAMQDVEECRENIKGCIKNDNITTQLDKKKAIGRVINCIGTLAKQIDVFKEGLPDEYPLKATLLNLVRNRLDDDFKELILCCRDCFGTDVSSLKECMPSFKIIRSESCIDFFTLLKEHTFSVDWIPETETLKDKKSTWIEYLRELYAQSEKSSLTADETGINKLSDLSNRFLMAYTRTVTEARRVLEDSLKNWNRHEPHYALFLAFLRLMEHARAELNTLTGRHLDFYYREILQFKEKEVVPPKAHVLVELTKQVPSYLIKAGEEFKAGKDELGKDVFFASERDFVANRAKVAALKTVYLHGAEEIIKEKEEEDKEIHQGRIYASSDANSEDGQGGELISEDKSWHPFFNKKYENGKVSEIKMPKAAVGFAIASHYLWMAGGDRTVTLNFVGTSLPAKLLQKHGALCFFTGPEGWIAGELKEKAEENALQVNLSGSEPAVVPYSLKIHKYFFKTELNFKTNLPVLLIRLNQKDTEKYTYEIFRNLKFEEINLKIEVGKLKPLVVSNDFGPVDNSKSFQPFGASPVQGSALFIGLKEIFQQQEIEKIKANLTFRNNSFKTYKKEKVGFTVSYLMDGKWNCYNDSNLSQKVFCENTKDIFLFGELDEKKPSPYISNYNFLKQDYIDNSSINGFVKIQLNTDFGQKEYEDDILKCGEKNTGNDTGICINKLLPKRPEGPFIAELTIDYETEPQKIVINSAKDIESTQASFFHVAPFGCAEQYLSNPDTSNKGIYLLPQLALPPEKKADASDEDSIHEAAEFYIGITDLKPPQNLSLLFQVADGTANPEKEKPKYPHIHWSYLRNNEWITFPSHAVDDYTDELITSGIITFAVPRDASDDNTLLPAGMHWIRAAVSSNPDAVCRLRMVEAQAVKVKFVDKENDSNFSAKTLLKDSITKLARPAAEVKKITQPFPSYGGRGKESSKAFYTRVSERLRHKDRAITFWDYERLILEAFPEVHKVKCLNHTSYEYDKEKNKCVLNENAPGHVTVVTIANQEHHSLPDPLRPNVSLGLQKKIEEFLRPKLSSFVKLHVVNPKFEEIKVDFRVKLHQGVDETYSINTLQEAIVSFLSPWAFTGNVSPSFGGKIYKSVLINFVEEKDYVDYLTDFQLFVDGGKDTETAEGSDAISILTSAHVSKHIIKITND